MFLNVYNFKLLVSISLIYIIIKVIDNIIDNEGYLDEKRLLPEKGLLPYIVIMMGVSCLLNTTVTISLVFSAYAIGMFEDLNRTFLFRLKGYQESIIVLIIGIIFLGFSEMLSSLSIISCIQLIDDLIDMKKDKFTHNKNYVFKFGIVETSIMSIILFLISLLMSPNKTIISFLIFAIFQYVENSIIWRKYNVNSNK